MLLNPLDAFSTIALGQIGILQFFRLNNIYNYQKTTIYVYISLYSIVIQVMSYYFHLYLSNVGHNIIKMFFTPFFVFIFQHLKIIRLVNF